VDRGNSRRKFPERGRVIRVVASGFV